MEFRILGPVEVRDGGAVVPLGAPKQRALLAALLLRANEFVPRDLLVDAVWGERPPDAATNSLQVYVHGLRKALGGERIETRGTGYRVRAERAELDLARFDDLVARARSALEDGRPADAEGDLRAALALWSGEPLADLAAEPIAAEAQALAERRLLARELHVDARLALGEHDAVVAELAGLVAEQPYRERLREQLVLALYRAGRQKEALDAYQDARRTLADELGVDPGPALRELERAILRQEETLAVSERSSLAGSLPTAATPLVGRRLEVATVGALLRDGARLVTLTGPGGVGKTRLALEIAAEHAPTLRDGAAFVDLSGLDDASLLAAAIESALGLDDAQTLVSSLRDRRLLLVLDNLERLLEGVNVIADLIGATAHVSVLATSRTPLRVRGEHEYPVPSLDVPARNASFESRVGNDAVRLFVDRARAVDPAFVLDEGTAEDVAAIVRRLDGLPLALELAAARTRVLSPAQIARRLEDSLDVLGRGARDLPERQRTLNATIDWTYEALEPEAQRAFRELSVFAGGFTLELAGLDVDVIEALVDNSLMRRRGERFALLEPIREYARDKLRAAGEENAARDRHLERLLAYAERLNAHITAGTEIEEAYELLEREQGNLSAALDWAAASGRLADEARLAIALRMTWAVRGHLREGWRRFAALVARCEGATDALRAAVLTHAAAFPYRLDELAVAEAWWEEALALHRALGDDDETARCLGELGSVAISRGDLERAGTLYAQSAELFERIDNDARLAVVLGNLAALSNMRGDLDAAVAYGLRAADLQRSVGDRDGLAVTTHNLARSELARGNGGAARRLLGEAIAVGRSIGYREALAYCLQSVGEVVFRDGELQAAARLLGAAEVAFDELGIRIGPEEEQGRMQALDGLRGALGQVELEAELAVGRAMPFEDAVAEAAALTDR